MTARLIWDVSHVCGLTCFSSSKMKMMAVTSLTTPSVCVDTRALGMPHKAVTFLKKTSFKCGSTPEKVEMKT